MGYSSDVWWRREASVGSPTSLLSPAELTHAAEELNPWEIQAGTRAAQSKPLGYMQATSFRFLNSGAGQYLSANSVQICNIG